MYTYIYLRVSTIRVNECTTKFEKKYSTYTTIGTINMYNYYASK